MHGVDRVRLADHHRYERGTGEMLEIEIDHVAAVLHQAVRPAQAW